MRAGNVFGTIGLVATAAGFGTLMALMAAAAVSKPTCADGFDLHDVRAYGQRMEPGISAKGERSPEVVQNENTQHEGTYVVVRVCARPMNGTEHADWWKTHSP